MKEPFRFSDGQQANNAEELLKICQESPKMGIYYLLQGDFENWFIYIGEDNLAQKAQQARESSGSDEEKLHQFLTSCQGDTVTETSVIPTPSPETETPEVTETSEVTEPSKITENGKATEISEVTETSKPTETSEVTATSEVTTTSASTNPLAGVFKALENLFTGQ